MENKYLIKSFIVVIGILSCMVALPGSKKKSVQIRKKASLVALQKKKSGSNPTSLKLRRTGKVATPKKSAAKKSTVKKASPKKSAPKIQKKKPTVSKKVAVSKKSTAAQTAAKKVSSPTFNISDEYGNTIKIVLIKDADITKQKNVDAIVNAANSTLLGGGGIDGAIHDAAGPQLQKYCEKLHGCPTGESRISPAFKLSKNGIRYIIHTVGPRGSMDDRKELLYGAYRSIFHVAQKNKLKSVVIPTISTGIFGYPLKEATEVALDALRWYIGNVNNKSLKEVRFIVWGNEHYNLYKKAFVGFPRLVSKQKTKPKLTKKIKPSNPEALGNCPICQEDLDAAPVEQRKKLSCGHLLHEECFKQCQEHGTSRCPVCRKDVIAVVPAAHAPIAPAINNSQYAQLAWRTLSFNLSDGSIYNVVFNGLGIPYLANRTYRNGQVYAYSINQLAEDYYVFSDGSSVIILDVLGVYASFRCPHTDDDIDLDL